MSDQMQREKQPDPKDAVRKGFINWGALIVTYVILGIIWFNYRKGTTLYEPTTVLLAIVTIACPSFIFPFEGIWKLIGLLRQLILKFRTRNERAKKMFLVSYTDSSFLTAKWMTQQLIKLGYSTVRQPIDKRPLDDKNTYRHIKMEAQKVAHYVVTVLSPDYYEVIHAIQDGPKLFFELHSDKKNGILVSTEKYRFEQSVAQLIQLITSELDQEQAEVEFHYLTKNISSSRKPDLTNDEIKKELKVIGEVRYPGKTPVVWCMPDRNPYFTGRGETNKTDRKQITHSEIIDEHLSKLYSIYKENMTRLPIQPQAITGISGIGKTELAKEYAYCYHRHYDYGLWITLTPGADSLDKVAKEIDPSFAGGQKRAAQIIKGWLGRNEKWLLILDDCDDPETLKDFVPDAPRGSVLVTTQASTMKDFAYQIHLKEMNRSDGALFLLRQAGIVDPYAPLTEPTAVIRREAEEIVAAMDGLPLAIENAGAYIRSGISLTSYKHIYGQHRRDFAKGPKFGYEISYRRVEKKYPAAAQLLQFCAFLNPRMISLDVLKKAPDLAPDLAMVMRDEYAFNNTLLELQRFSLIEKDRERDTLSMNGFLQDVLKDGMSEADQKAHLLQVVKAVGQAFPQVDTYTVQSCRHYEPQARRCMELIAQWNKDWPNDPFPDIPEVTLLYVRFGCYLRECACYDEAEKLFMHSSKGLSTQNSLMAATYKYHLGQLRYQQTQYIEARKLYEEVLSIYNQPGIVGVTPLEKARVLIGLADVLDDLEKAGEAKDAYTLVEQILRPSLAAINQCETIVAVDVLEYLARAYERLNNQPEAEKLLLQVEDIATRAWGKDNLRVIALKANRVRFQFARGKGTDEDYTFYRWLVNSSRQIFGINHPLLARRVLNLALICQKRQDYVAADQLYQEALQLYDRGPANHLGKARAKLLYTAFLKNMKNNSNQAKIAHLEEQTRKIYQAWGIQKSIRSI